MFGGGKKKGGPPLDRRNRFGSGGQTPLPPNQISHYWYSYRFQVRQRCNVDRCTPQDRARNLTSLTSWPDLQALCLSFQFATRDSNSGAGWEILMAKKFLTNARVRCNLTAPPHRDTLWRPPAQASLTGREMPQLVSAGEKPSLVGGGPFSTLVNAKTQLIGLS